MIGKSYVYRTSQSPLELYKPNVSFLMVIRPISRWEKCLGCLWHNTEQKVLNYDAETHRIPFHAIEILQCNEFMVK